MKRTIIMAVVGGITIAFAAGHLTAQPPPAGAPVKPPAMTADQRVFQGDLNAALNQNNDAKTAKLLADAAGDAELTNVVVEKLWNYEDRNDPRAETLQGTFSIQQRQRQLELSQAILAELKKSQRAAK
jgi:hypothetical protein